MSNRSGISTALYLSLVFISGVLVGVFSYRLYMVNTVQSALTVQQQPRTPEDYRKKVVDEMTSRLKLNGGQVGTLQNVLDETRNRYHAARKSIEEFQHQSILAMLSEPQKTEYEKMRAERERRREAERKKQQQQQK